MSDRKTKRLSGAQYKKRKLEKEEYRRKLSGSLQKFLVPSTSSQGTDTRIINNQNPISLCCYAPPA